MARFQRSYGYDYDQHPSAGGYRGRIGGYRGTTGGYRGAQWGRGYDRVYGDYAEGYRSRARTDAGDPFGDRQSGTPIRVIRDREDERWFGRDRGDYDREVWNPGLGFDHNYRHRYHRYGYGRDYRGTRPARGNDAGGGWFW